MTTKTPLAADRHAGARVRMRRQQLNMSQEKLGDALGLTFQQVQKYEKGANRMGTSRLHQIAAVLQVPPAFFFEGLTINTTKGGIESDIATMFMSQPNAVQLAQAYTKLPKPVQALVLNMAQGLAESLVRK